MTRLLQMDLYEIGEGKVLPELAGQLADTHRVLDLWCGEGEWVMAMAQAHPHMQVEGIDTNAGFIEAARRQARLASLDNVSFRVVPDPLHASSIPDDSFDLVNARFVVDFVPLDSWSLLVQEGLRLLRPGGILRLTEGDSPITTSPATERLSALLAQALWLAQRNLCPPTSSGQNLLITPKLGRSLRDARCRDIHHMAFVTNFSHRLPAHRIISQNLATVYQDVTPFLLEQQVTTQEEVASLRAQMLLETQEDTFNAVGFYLTVVGQKP